MTKIDCLIEVAKKLKEARALGERSSDRALLYFIDMTLAHVCDQLDARAETKGAKAQRIKRNSDRRLKLDRGRLLSELARQSRTPART